MIWLLKMILFGHVHKWKEVGRYTLNTKDPYNGSVVRKGTRVVTVCEKCGAHRKWDLV